jgi:hypothetical protein
MTHRGVGFAVFAALGLAAGVGHVEAAPLGALVGGGTIEVGGLRFSNFELRDVSELNSTPSPLLALDVSGFVNGMSEAGLRFDTMTVIAPDAQGLGNLRFILEYDVTALAPLTLVGGVHHAVTATVNRASNMIMSSQAGFAPNLNAYMQDLVGNEGTGENVLDSFDEAQAFLTPVVTQHMLHDFQLRAEVINLNGTPVLGRLTTRTVEVTFRTAAVPEPGSAALLGVGVGAVAAGVLRRRRRAGRVQAG